jgi:hypothetical protein
VLVECGVVGGTELNSVGGFAGATARSEDDVVLFGRGAGRASGGRAAEAVAAANGICGAAREGVRIIPAEDGLLEPCE